MSWRFRQAKPALARLLLDQFGLHHALEMLGRVLVYASLAAAIGPDPHLIDLRPHGDAPSAVWADSYSLEWRPAAPNLTALPTRFRPLKPNGGAVGCYACTPRRCGRVHAGFYEGFLPLRRLLAKNSTSSVFLLWLCA